MKFVPIAGTLFALDRTEDDFGSPTMVELAPDTAWLLVGGTWVLLMIYCLAVGWRQTKEAKGTLSRLLWVSAFLSTMGILPVAVLALFAQRGGCRLAPVLGCSRFDISFADLLRFVFTAARLSPGDERTTSTRYR